LKVRFRNVLRRLRLAARGRPGQLDGDMVFCPLVGSWIGATIEAEIAGGRTLYDNEEQSPVVDEAARDFNQAASGAGWALPSQLLEAVTVCEYCEAYCYAEDDGPASVPPIAEIDRAVVLRDLGVASTISGRTAGRG
jgi:hypothetical protein